MSISVVSILKACFGARARARVNIKSLFISLSLFFLEKTMQNRIQWSWMRKLNNNEYTLFACTRNNPTLFGKYFGFWFAFSQKWVKIAQEWHSTQPWLCMRFFSLFIFFILSSVNCCHANYCDTNFLPINIPIKRNLQLWYQQYLLCTNTASEFISIRGKVESYICFPHKSNRINGIKNGNAESYISNDNYIGLAQFEYINFNFYWLNICIPIQCSKIKMSVTLSFFKALLIDAWEVHFFIVLKSIA